MEKTKQFKTYLVATVIGLAATVGLFAYEGAVTSNVDAKAQTSSFTTATIKFNNDGSYLSYTSSPKTVKSNQFKYNDVDNCSYNDNGLQIGSIGYYLDLSNWPWGWDWYSFTTGGSYSITLNSIKYQSVRIYSNSSPDIAFNVNGISTVTNNNAHSQYDYYYCSDTQSKLTITVPNNIEANKRLSVQKIEFHLK